MELDLESQMQLIAALVGALQEDNVHVVQQLGAMGLPLKEMRLAGGSTLLHIASLAGACEASKFLVETVGMDVNATDEDGDTPLINSLFSGNVKLIMFLLENGVDIKKRNKKDIPPICFAAARNLAGVVEELLKRGISVTEKYNFDFTALHYAASGGGSNAIQLLVSRGADLNAQCVDGRTPAHIAALEEKPHAVQLLLSLGADFTLRDIKGNTPLDLVPAQLRGHISDVLRQRGVEPPAPNTDPVPDVKYCDEDEGSPKEKPKERSEEMESIVRDVYLLVTRPVPNKEQPTDDESALFAAVETGNALMLERFFEQRGYPVDWAGPQSGACALSVAVVRGDLRMVQYLLAKGADPNRKDNDDDTPLHMVGSARNAVGHPVEIAKALIAAGAKVNALDKNGNTPLKLAVRHCNFYVAQLLLENGADVDIKDTEGATALHQAAFGRGTHQEELLSMVLERASDVNVADNDGWTPLHYACKQAVWSNVRALVKAGANVNVRSTDKAATTPLHLTARGDAGRVYEGLDFLIRQGAGINVQDGLGKTPLHYTAAAGMLEESVLLVKHGARTDVMDAEGSTPANRANAIVFNAMEAMSLQVSGGREALRLTQVAHGLKALTERLKNSEQDYSAAVINLWRAGNISKLIEFLSAHNINVVRPPAVPALHLAIAFGEMDLVEFLLDAGASTEVRDSDGDTALLITVNMSQGRSEKILAIMELLLKRGANVNARNSTLSTPVKLAARSGDVDAVALLLKYGADPNIVDNEHFAPLHNALVNRDKAVAAKLTRMLLEAGASPNICTITQTPLVVAVQHNPELVPLLLQHGAHPNVYCGDDSTHPIMPIIAAAQAPVDDPDLIKLLLAHGANPNQRGNRRHTPLLWAANKGKEKTIYALIEAGADINATDEEGNNAFRLMAPHGELRERVIRFCQERGLNMQDWDDADDATQSVIDKQAEAATHMAVENNIPGLAAVYSEGLPLHAMYRSGSNMVHPLHAAARIGAVMAIEFLVKRGCQIDIRDDGGMTPLHVAVDAMRVQSVEKLLSLGADVNVYSSSGVTPLHTACLKGEAAMVRFLLRHGAKPNIAESAGWTSVHVAAKTSAVCLRIVVSHGGNVNARKADGWTPLHLAASNDGFVGSLFLLEHGADPCAFNSDNQTPFDVATARVRDAMIRKCDELGLRVPDKVQMERYVRAVEPLGDPELASEMTKLDEHFAADTADVADMPLWAAVSVNDLEAVKALLGSGCQPDIKGPMGATPLMSAAATGFAAIVKTLLKHGADINHQDKNGQTALLHALRSEQVLTSKLLIEAGADVNLANKEGHYPLIVACSHPLLTTLVPMLLAAGAKVDVHSGRSSQSITPLHGASMLGALEVVEQLLAAGADVNAKADQGVTPLMFAVTSANTAVVKRLLAAGADAKAIARNNESALHENSRSGNGEIAKLLVEAGADVNLQDTGGETPLHLAMATGRMDVAQALIAAGADTTLRTKEGKTAHDLLGAAAIQASIQKVIDSAV